MNIYLCPSPELYNLYHRAGASVIITDIFRASTTITTALEQGATRILPVATVEECQEIGEAQGYLMAAERNIHRCPFAQLGNDPLAYTPDVVLGKTIVITTTNGTRSLAIARDCGAEEIMIGSFRNLTKTLDYLQQQGRKEVVVLAAGWRGQVSTEDCLYAGALAVEAERRGIGKAMGDAAVMLASLWQSECYDREHCLAYIQRSEHYARLEQAGHLSAVEYCLTLSDAPAVILNNDGYLVPTN